MLIIGAKGFAKQLIEILLNNGESKDLFFFDDVSLNISNELYGIKIVKNIEEVYNIFKSDQQFCLGIGNPLLRESLSIKFENLGGKLTSVISKNAYIASHVKEIGIGCTILTSAIVENDVFIGKAVLVNSLAAIFHDSIIGDFVEIAPGAKVLGNVKIGNKSFVGANATILPGVQIGENVLIGAGAIVNKNVTSNSIVAGVPAKPLKDES